MESVLGGLTFCCHHRELQLFVVFCFEVLTMHVDLVPHGPTGRSQRLRFRKERYVTN